MQNIPFHPLAEIFPLTHGEEFVQLKQDIKENGVLEPIWMYEGKILDGRNRFRACQEVGVIPEFKDYAGESPASFVISLNMHRRHLTASQRAAAAVEVLPWLEQEAKVRQAATLKQNVDTVPVILPEREKGDARDKAAELTGASPRYVSDAKRIKVEQPQEFEKIKAGEKTISQVKRESAPDEPEEVVPQEVRPLLQSRGVGMKYAHEAIAVLKRIPLNDGLRQDAFSMVLDWIETNKSHRG